MDNQGTEGKKNYFMIPQLLLISESTTDTFCSGYQLRSGSSSSFPSLNRTEHLSFDLSIGVSGRRGGGNGESKWCRNWLMANAKGKRERRMGRWSKRDRRAAEEWQ